MAHFHLYLCRCVVTEWIILMGEKIRDIRSINLIGSDLMVELNEGYTKSEGRVIHIQNKKFRYLLKESDFYQVSTLIMRANVEEEYIKSHYKIDKPKKLSVNTVTNVQKFTFIKELTSHKIEYRVLSTGERIIQILINPEHMSAAEKLIKKKKMVKLPHPYGIERGYIFLYQMKPFIMCEYEGLYYEIMCQLPCMSLTPMTWIPLDRSVQKSVWKDKITENGVDYINKEDELIYRIVTCIFRNRSIGENDKKYFTEKKAILDSQSLLDKMHLIVFNFTDELIQMMRNEKYDKIIEAYFSFTNY